ncbi:MAG: nitronate monooxygenase [Lachnospiraceae bacterium]|nr:nitronate monooxygenase [Lachnospiraceae bacterium]
MPVIQGGMGVGISLDGLAGAVAAEGGVGVISTAQIGFRDPDYDKNPLEANLRAIPEYLKKAREKAQGGVIGMNIMVATKHYEEYVKTAAKAGVDLIISGAGLPVNLPELVEGFQTKIAPIVSTVKSAMVILKLWDRKYHRVPDLLVIEGPEAGGHLGFKREELSTYTKESYAEEVRGILKLVKEYASRYEKEIPVALAGGIYDKTDVEYAMSLGVDAVQMATRFVTTVECDAAEEYKQAYINCKEEDIEIVQSPVGMPGRAMHNKFQEQLSTGVYRPKKCRQCIATCEPAKTPYCITQALVNAANGNTDDALLFCGAKAYKAEKIETVHEVFASLC